MRFSELVGMPPEIRHYFDRKLLSNKIAPYWERMERRIAEIEILANRIRPCDIGRRREYDEMKRKLWEEREREDELQKIIKTTIEKKKQERSRLQNSGTLIFRRYKTEEN